jgi:hypothetical protein
LKWGEHGASDAIGEPLERDVRGGGGGARVGH